jgi:hypothetical protein
VASRYRWCEPSTSGQDVHRPERHRAGVACGLQSLGGSRPAPPLHERASRGDGRCGGRGGSSRSRVRRPCADGLVAYRGLEVRGQTLWVESSSRGWRRFYDGSTACIIAYGVVTFAVSGIARYSRAIPVVLLVGQLPPAVQRFAYTIDLGPDSAATGHRRRRHGSLSTTDRPTATTYAASTRRPLAPLGGDAVPRATQALFAIAALEAGVCLLAASSLWSERLPAVLAGLAGCASLVAGGLLLRATGSAADKWKTTGGERKLGCVLYC